jgi:hypothetical protein
MLSVNCVNFWITSVSQNLCRISFSSFLFNSLIFPRKRLTGRPKLRWKDLSIQQEDGTDLKANLDFDDDNDDDDDHI